MTTLNESSNQAVKKSRLIYSNEFIRHYVFSPPLFITDEVTSDSLMKVESFCEGPTIEDTVRDLITEKRLDPDGEHFGFWQDTFPGRSITHTELKESVDRIPEHGIEKYGMRTAPYAGIDLERLLPDPAYKCSGCRPSDHPRAHPQLHMSARYALLFLEHLLSSLELLQKVGVVHGDLRLANILVNPTDAEVKEGILRTSLPRLIDFGFSRILEGHDMRYLDAHNRSYIESLFSTCKHGRESFRIVSEADGIDRTSWLTTAVLEAERPQIQGVLDVFLDPDIFNKYNVQSLLKIVRKAKDKGV